MLHITYLLEYAKGKEKMFNKISNKLWAEFDIKSAEVTLVVLYMIYEMREEFEDEN